MAIDTRIKWVALAAVEYSPKDGGGEVKTRFTRLGVAFWNKENDRGDQTLSVILDALPVNGKIVLMPDRPRDDEKSNQRSGGGGYGGS